MNIAQMSYEEYLQNREALIAEYDGRDKKLKDEIENIGTPQAQMSMMEFMGLWSEHVISMMFNPHYVMTPDEESLELIRLVEEREKRQTQSAG